MQRIGIVKIIDDNIPSTYYPLRKFRAENKTFEMFYDETTKKTIFKGTTTFEVPEYKGNQKLNSTDYKIYTSDKYITVRRIDCDIKAIIVCNMVRGEALGKVTEGTEVILHKIKRQGPNTPTVEIKNSIYTAYYDAYIEQKKDYIILRHDSTSTDGETIAIFKRI